MASLFIYPKEEEKKSSRPEVHRGRNGTGVEESQYGRRKEIQTCF
jgi:hypothetical protein